MLLWPWHSRGRLLADAKLLGRWGERRCERFLRKKGLRVIARNYSCNRGEVDLIMSDGASMDGTIVFVEVKTRRDEKHALARDAVGHRKQERLARLAKHFLTNYKIKNKPWRFDVVAVVLGEKGPAKIRHYENAFRP